MPDSLTAWAADRSKLLQQLVGLGDLRPESITATIRRCGKPTCHCAKPNDPDMTRSSGLPERDALAPKLLNGGRLVQTGHPPGAIRLRSLEVENLGASVGAGRGKDLNRVTGHARRRFY